MNTIERQAVRELATSAGKFFGGAVLGGLGAVIVIYGCLRAGLTELETLAVLAVGLMLLVMADTLRTMFRVKVREIEYRTARDDKA